MTQLLFIFIIGALAAIYARFDFVHFQPALPFVVIATVAGFSAIWSKKYSKWLVIIYLLVTSWWLSIFYRGHLLSKVFFFDQETYQLAAKVRQYTKPQQKIFVFGAVPHLYQMTNTLPAGDIFVFQFPWFMMVAENRVLEGIKNDQPIIVVSNPLAEIEGQKIADFAKKIDQYLGENYQTIDRVGEVKILRRKSR